MRGFNLDRKKIYIYIYKYFYDNYEKKKKTIKSDKWVNFSR